MKINNFFVRYSEEENCKQFFKEQREKRGIKYVKESSTCGHPVKPDSNAEKFKYLTGLKNGTVMENSNFRYRIWLRGLYFMSLTKKGFLLWKCNVL